MSAQDSVVQGGGVSRVRKFVREVRAELKKVSWPGRQELVSYTGVVFVTVLVVAALIAGIDFVFSEVLRFVIHM